VTAFVVSPNPVARGGSVTISWNVTGATSVQIRRMAEQGDAVMETLVNTGTVSGTFAYTLPADYINVAPFELSATSADGQETLAQTQIAIQCQFSSSLTTDCPLTQLSVQAAYQAFEHGFMIWKGDTREIYVLLNDGTWSKNVDTYVDGESLTIPAAPSGLTAPNFGFGKLWLQLGGGGSALGWANLPETGYQATLETHQVWVNGAPTTVTVISLADGRKVTLTTPWSSS
jgi:hypothetical protein